MRKRINDEPWFVGKDVAEALAYKDTVKALRDHVDPEDKCIAKQGETPYLNITSPLYHQRVRSVLSYSFQ